MGRENGFAPSESVVVELGGFAVGLSAWGAPSSVLVRGTRERRDVGRQEVARRRLATDRLGDFVRRCAADGGPTQ
jgi:hypothetical protein